MTATPKISVRDKLKLALKNFENHLACIGEPACNLKDDDLRKKHIEREKDHIQNLAVITTRLEEYENWVENADYNDLLTQEHDSERLGENMRAAGRAKPSDRYDAHAIVSGKHQAAAPSRIILAEVGVGVDEHHNGAWLPRSGDDARKSNNWATEGAVPHSRVHRKSICENIEKRLKRALKTPLLDEFIKNRLKPIKDADRIREELKHIGQRLTEGSLPPEILEEINHANLQNT